MQHRLRVVKAGWFALVVGIALPSLAQAQVSLGSSGTKLLENCTEHAKADLGTGVSVSWYQAGLCAGYVNGVWDVSDKICTPKGSTLGQAIRVVLKYLNDHPERLHEHMAELVVDALRAAWPCKRKAS